MKFDNSLIRGRMAEMGYNQRKMAEALGISPQSFSKKIRGETEFTRSEILTMALLLNIVDGLGSVFFRT